MIDNNHYLNDLIVTVFGFIWFRKDGIDFILFFKVSYSRLSRGFEFPLRVVCV